MYSKHFPAALLLLIACVTTYVACQSQPTREISTPPNHDSASQQTDAWTSLVDESSVGGWKFIKFGGREAFEIKDGKLSVEAGYPMAGLVYSGEFQKTDYELELEAKKIDGTDFFCLLTFPVNEQFCSLVVGGWGGTVTGISCVNQVDASENETRSVRKYEYDRWYRIRVKVTADNLMCWIDDELIVDLKLQGNELSLRTDVDNTKPLGLCSFETAAAWQNIRYQSLK